METGKNLSYLSCCTDTSRRQPLSGYSEKDMVRRLN